jgi:hypothetical protein
MKKLEMLIMIMIIILHLSLLYRLLKPIFQSVFKMYASRYIPKKAGIEIDLSYSSTWLLVVLLAGNVVTQASLVIVLPEGFSVYNFIYITELVLWTIYAFVLLKK